MLKITLAQVLLTAALPITPLPEATVYIDRDHPEVLRLSRIIANEAREDDSVAARIHGFVRGGVKFGWTSSFNRAGAPGAPVSDPTDERIAHIKKTN